MYGFVEKVGYHLQKPPRGKVQLTFALFRRLISMIYQYKHTNLPMSLLEIKIRQAG